MITPLLRHPLFRWAQPLLAAAALSASWAGIAQAADTPPAEVHLDYAYYSPTSLVLKHFGWLEQALPGTKVSWVLSQGSTVRWNTSTAAASTSPPPQALPRY